MNLTEKQTNEFLEKISGIVFELNEIKAQMHKLVEATVRVGTKLDGIPKR